MTETRQLNEHASHERARKTAGQRRVNLLWETTQSVIAVSVTGFTLTIAANLALKTAEPAPFILMSNAFFLVIGFYFGRTNHGKTGGVGGENARESR